MKKDPATSQPTLQSLAQQIGENPYGQTKLILNLVADMRKQFDEIRQQNVVLLSENEGLKSSLTEVQSFLDAEKEIKLEK